MSNQLWMFQDVLMNKILICLRKLLDLIGACDTPTSDLRLIVAVLTHSTDT